MNLYKTMVKLLEANTPFALATIVSRSGSAPRTPGTRMIVLADGAVEGSVGGGILEAGVLELAGDCFEYGKARIGAFNLTSADAREMGMTCGGRVRVLVQLIHPAEARHLELFRAVRSTLENREQAWLIAEVPPEDKSAVPVGMGFCPTDGPCVGNLDEETLRKVVLLAGTGPPQSVCCEGRSYLVEPLCHEAVVFIFGAGHISRQLAPLAKRVGFHTVVLDDREEFANRERFPDADRIVVPSGFDSVIPQLDIDENSYLVLVTRGHHYDGMLLGEALRTKAGYIGMIGSRRKRDGIYAELARKGFTSSDFQRVHSPIGLNIGAETPEEIAVSIVAELIQVRAGKNG